MSFIGHYYMLSEELPPLKETHAMEYWTACNGVFVRARREGIEEALIPVARSPRPIKKLFPLEPKVTMTYPRVDQALMVELLAESMMARGEQGEPVELLFHLRYLDQAWHYTKPEQDRQRMRVTPTVLYDTELPPPVLDLHSHHTMDPFFSGTDTRDDQGFRFNAVLGNIYECPTIVLRLGIYGHFYPLPASTLFELPPIIQDACLPRAVAGGFR